MKKTKCEDCKGTNLCHMHFVKKHRVFGAEALAQARKESEDIIPQPKRPIKQHLIPVVPVNYWRDKE